MACQISCRPVTRVSKNAVRSLARSAWVHRAEGGPVVREDVFVGGGEAADFQRRGVLRRRGPGGVAVVEFGMPRAAEVADACEVLVRER
jgi:hypothetical protein